MKANIEKILFLGDILISFGDFLYNSQLLAPSGYVEEWWIEDLAKVIEERFGNDLERTADHAKVSPDRLRAFLKDPFVNVPSITEAIALASLLNTPLHPHFTYFWSSLSSVAEIALLREWLVGSETKRKDLDVVSIEGAFDVRIKEVMEVICLPHEISDGRIAIRGEDAHAFASCLSHANARDVDLSSATSVLEALALLSGLRIMQKGPTFVGARMGRPEKAKRREMNPLVHALFPVGLAGGSKRNIVEAAEGGPTFVEVVKRKCLNCRSFTFRIKCPACGSETMLERSCPLCGKSLKGEECPVCKVPAKPYQKQAINFKEMLDEACRGVSVATPRILKGVRGLTNTTKTPEIVEKGLLRAKYDLAVYKDGTIRFDATNAPLTHFKPEEIGVSIEKLRQLGYIYAADGSLLTNQNQICELKLQDVVISNGNAEYFVRIAKFIDELLAKVYGLQPYYNVKEVADLLGHLVVGLAPHTCAGVLGRIIGFTRLSLCYAHPIWHSAKRRDCDGDEDALMLALDTLINFSREYLPAQIGGIMDAPLLLISIVNTKEVQRQAYDFDVADAYPVEFYVRSGEGTEARQVSPILDLVGSRLGVEAQYEGFRFTTPTSNINMGNSESAYKRFKAMTEKLDCQLELAEKIKAVDVKVVALKVLTTHFIRDIAGNLRAFSTQAFRCKSCSRRYRRLPLRGRCSRCGGHLSLTVYRGGIEKYVDVARRLTEKYGLPQYYAQRILLMEEEISAMFGNRKPKQVTLADFA